MATSLARVSAINLRLKAFGISDACEVGARNDVLTDFDRNDLHDAFDTSADVQRFEFAAAKLVKGTLLFKVRLLGEQPRLCGVGRVLQL